MAVQYVELQPCSETGAGELKSMRSTHLRAAALAILVLVSGTAPAAKPELRCRADGTFKIVMFSDTQDDETLDPRTTALMEKVLDAEKPDFVVVGGDCISGGECGTVDEVKQAITQVARPIETREISWAIVFGNHDQEHFARTHLGKDEVIAYYASFPHNMNVRGDLKIHGVGNDVLLVGDKVGRDPIFCVWLLDSGEYAPKNVGGYEWIHADQVAWYHRTSKEIQRRYGHRVPGVMFFHIPLQEFARMHARGVARGDRNEPEAASKIRSSIFPAIVERGDVKGIFCGHDHVNNYVGEWHGVMLGYDAAAGYNSYNLPDSDPSSARTHGGRVFLVSESDPWHFRTWMRFVNGSTGP